MVQLARDGTWLVGEGERQVGRLFMLAVGAEKKWRGNGADRGWVKEWTCMQVERQECMGVGLAGHASGRVWVFICFFVFFNVVVILFFF